MDSAPKQIAYDEQKLLPFDNRARMKRFSKEIVGAEWVTTEKGPVMLFSAAGDYMGSFESPSHAEIYCAAKGVELFPDVEEITWESLKNELASWAYSPNFIFQAAP